MREQIFVEMNTTGVIWKMELRGVLSVLLRSFSNDRYALSTLHDAFQCCFLFLLFLPLFAFGRGSGAYTIGLSCGLLHVLIDAGLQLRVHLPLPLLLFPALGSLFLRSEL